jgi:carbamoyltransferase
MTSILGISAYYHDAAAALVRDGAVVAAAQEERFSRRKYDSRFPENAVRYCLREANASVRDLEGVVFYEKPLIKLERLFETHLGFAPRGLRSFISSMPEWTGKKLRFRRELERGLTQALGCSASELPALWFTEHHEAHAAAAFFASPFRRAGVLCLDGVGEWTTTSVWLGDEERLEPVWEERFPHSLGLLYSAFTYHTGFKVDSGEYKLMGLAPYGQPKYVDRIRRHLIDVKEDGTFRLNLSHFGFATGLTMTNSRFEALFEHPRRAPEAEVREHDKDMARSIQVVIEDVMLRLARSVHRELDVERLCLAGGVALNCVANGRLLREGPFEEIWIQPAAGDAGGALGAALAVWHEHLKKPRTGGDIMGGARLGPRYAESEIREQLDARGARYESVDEDALVLRVAREIADGKVVGWFQGRMEFGPRALGSRSILADPRNPEMRRLLNEKIKRRELFRPFAPAIKAEATSRWFELDGSSPYMLLTVPTRADAGPRLPATTHVDGSARVQTVDRETDPRFWALLDAFERLTGCPVLINTSFNVRGEPIVCAPQDAVACFMNSGLDLLVMENLLLARSAQPASLAGEARRFEPD